MQAQSKSFAMTLLGAVCVHAAGLGLAWKLTNDSDEKLVKASLSSSTIMLLSKPALAKPGVNETTLFEPFMPTHVAQFEPDSVAETTPSPLPKSVEATKDIIAKKVSHVAEIKAPAKPAKKVKAAKPNKPIKKASKKKLPQEESPRENIDPLIQPKKNSAEPSTPHVLASSSNTYNTNAAQTHIANIATDNASDSTATNKSVAAKDYYSELGTWLAKHKKYPRRARLRKQEGTALLYFVVDRDGRVLEYLVEESSGHRLLDKAVTAMLKRAEPLPKIPDIMHQAKLEITVPVEFLLH